MKEKQLLTNTEWEVCECLWESAPLTLTQIANRLTERTGWTRSTGETLVRRMAEKGLLRCEQTGRGKSYRPAVEQEQAVIAETHSFLDRVYQGSVGLMMSAMAKRQELTREEVAELRAILDQIEGGEGE